MPNTNQLIEELSRKFNNNLALQLKPSNDTMIAVRTAKGLFQEALKQALSQTEQECDKKWREGMKEVLNRMNYFYLKTDGEMEFPNSSEGDLLKMVYDLLNNK